MQEPFISEIIVKSEKAEHEIDFLEAVRKYWRKNGGKLFFLNSIAMVEKIGEEEKEVEK
jgi:hypothetical protein